MLVRARGIVIGLLRAPLVPPAMTVAAAPFSCLPPAWIGPAPAGTGYHSQAYTDNNEGYDITVKVKAGVQLVDQEKSAYQQQHYPAAAAKTMLDAGKDADGY